MLKLRFVLVDESLEILLQDGVGVQVHMEPDDYHECLQNESDQVLLREGDVTFQILVKSDAEHIHWLKRVSRGFTKVALIVFWGW